jgi:hypothetical protein
VNPILNERFTDYLVSIKQLTPFAGCPILERFRFKCCHLKSVRGGIFLKKMPLGPEDSVKSRIETAVGAFLRQGWGSTMVAGQ